MQLSDFDYTLPPERIAQEPAATRDAARLMVPGPGGVAHKTVGDLPVCLRPGDLVVVNDTRVRRARVFGRRATGGRVELFVLGREELPGQPWRALVNPARKLKPGEELVLETPEGEPHPSWRARALERLPHDVERAEDGGPRPGPCWRLEFFQQGLPASAEASLEGLFEELGQLPLPPYIHRDEERPEDAERYQTVFATKPGAVAAPTAGLHLTPGLLGELEARGVELARVTLHVGLGTFAPVEAERIADHVMHSEEWELPVETEAAVAACRARGGRVVAIGTTSVRVLETAAVGDGRVRAGRGATDIFITPGYEFRVVDVLLTNFHLPKSTLLMLVSALIGRERTLELYALAVREEYRFFSYGDAMLLERAVND